MPVLPKCVYTIGASVQTARIAHRLKRARSSAPAQRRALASLLEKFALTSEGRSCGIERAMRYEHFRDRVPLRTYEQLAPQIARMQRGEADVLWPGRCSLFARTAGTTSGQPKTLPVTDELLAHFRGAGATSLLHYTARVGHTEVFRGRHLLLGSASTLTPFTSGSFTSYVGDMSGIAALNLPAWAERHLHEPRGVAQIADWAQRIEQIIARTRRHDITLLAGLPNWLLGFTEALRQAETRGHPGTLHLGAIWPNLECVIHTGLPLAPFETELKNSVGPGVAFHEVYAASECFVAVQDAEPSNGLRLLDDAGVFFEFLPLAEYAAATASSVGNRAVPIEDVRTGEDYVVLVTTPGGLCRYMLGDVVRFTSIAPARLTHVGSAPLLLNAFAEQITEHDLTASLVAVCQRRGWSITNFHVAPHVASTLTGQVRGHHEWWIELKPLTFETPTGPLLAGELDRELLSRNPRYNARRNSGVMDAPVVRLVMPGFFGHWMRHHHKIGGLNKIPRSRPDRTIAEELSSLACFNA